MSNKFFRLESYIHGKGGEAGEAAHYIPLFIDCDMIVLNYTAQFPWEAKEEFEVGVSRVLYWIGCISSNGSSLFCNS